MKLTSEQTRLAEEVRKIMDWGKFADPFPAYDLADTIAVILDGVNSLAPGEDMGERFNAAWAAYMAIWKMEHDAAIVSAIGDQMLWDRVKRHPNGREALIDILTRIQEAHGRITPGLEVEVDVSDILQAHQII